MRFARPAFLLAGLLATSSALCGLRPQSFLDGDQPNKAANDLYRVRVTVVDGVAQRDNPVAVFPGPHWVEISTFPVTNDRASKPQTFVLKISPCMRYFLAARKDTRLSSKWKLVIEEESVLSCDPAEEMKKAEANPPPDGRAKPPH